MNLLDALTILERIGKRRSSEDFQLVIPITRVGSIGGTPCVEIEHIFEGIDWDKGRVMLSTKEKLRVITEDEIKSLQEQYEELGWKQYEISNLKRENKKLLKENEELRWKLSERI